uniref:Putative secreted protein n=1 Tax=Anopheles marajoara TaxID=58244 RepID=A0A2M4C6B6_9DIPT
MSETKLGLLLIASTTVLQQHRYGRSQPDRNALQQVEEEQDRYVAPVAPQVALLVSLLIVWHRKQRFLVGHRSLIAIRLLPSITHRSARAKKIDSTGVQRVDSEPEAWFPCRQAHVVHVTESCWLVSLRGAPFYGFAVQFCKRTNFCQSRPITLQRSTATGSL